MPLIRNSFAGRDGELAELERLVREAAVVTLVGPGGVGKTRLALEFVQTVLGRWPDGAAT
jgi:predicted ATPase